MLFSPPQSVHIQIDKYFRHGNACFKGLDCTAYTKQHMTQSDFTRNSPSCRHQLPRNSPTCTSSIRSHFWIKRRSAFESCRGVNYDRSARCRHASLCSELSEARFCHCALVGRFDLQRQGEGEPRLQGQGPSGSLPSGGEEGAPRQGR